VNNNGHKRAFSYARTSKEDLDNPKWSIPTQEQRIKDYCEQKDRDLAGTHNDRNESGVTPFDQRVGWSELEALLEEGDVVIVNELSRLSRDSLDAKIKMKELFERGIGVITLESDGIDISTADGTFMLDISLAVSERERRKLIERLLQIHKEIHRQGKPLGCRPPLGYDYDLEEKKFAIIPEEAALVRRIFALKIAGYGLNAIALRLHQEGIPTKRGGKWSANTISRILNNEFYTAQRTYLGETLPMDVPQIIDQETWNHARSTIARQTHLPRGSYALSGLLRCGICGGPMNRLRKTHDNEDNRLADWRCRSGMTDKECRGTSIREHIVERVVTEQFFDYVDGERYVEALQRRAERAQESKGRVESIEDHLKRVERKQARLTDEYLSGESITRDQYNRQNREYNEQVQELTEAIERLEGEAVLAGKPVRLGNIREDWKRLDPTLRREALRAFIDHVVVAPTSEVWGEDRVRVFWREV